jgi:hypothetical protein
MKSFNNWLEQKFYLSAGELPSADELGGQTYDTIPTVDVGSSGERMERQLDALAHLGYVGKFVTAQYGKDGPKETGKLAEGPEEVSGHRYFIDRYYRARNRK